MKELFTGNQDYYIYYFKLFEIEEKYVQLAINNIKLILGDNYVGQISKNMMLVDKVIEIAINYCEKDE